MPSAIRAFSYESTGRGFLGAMKTGIPTLSAILTIFSPGFLTGSSCTKSRYDISPEAAPGVSYPTRTVPFFPRGDRNDLRIEDKVLRRLIDIASLPVLRPLHQLQLNGDLFIPAVYYRESALSLARSPGGWTWARISKRPKRPLMTFLP